MKQDVELRCDKCGHETLATEGYYNKMCRHCNGIRRVVKEYGKILTFDEVKNLGYTIA